MTKKAAGEEVRVSAQNFCLLPLCLSIVLVGQFVRPLKKLSHDAYSPGKPEIIQGVFGGIILKNKIGNKMCIRSDFVN